MKLSFTVTIKQEIINSLINFISVPVLNIYEEMTMHDQLYIKTFGIKQYLHQLILDKLIEMDAAGHPYKEPKSVEKVLDMMLLDNSASSEDESLTCETLELVTSIDFDPQQTIKRCNCCEKFTPKFVITAISLELLVSGFLLVLAMDYAQGDHGLFDLDPQTDLAISVVSAVLKILWISYDIFSGGEMIFLKDSGASMDDQFLKLMDKFNCRKKSVLESQSVPTQNTAKPSCLTKPVILSATLKTVLVLGMLNDLYSKSMESFASIQSASNTVAQQKVIPTQAYLMLQYLRVSLEHLDDPLTYYSKLFLGFKAVNALIKKYFSVKPTSTLILMADKTSEENEAIMQARLSRVERWKNPVELNIQVDEVEYDEQLDDDHIHHYSVPPTQSSINQPLLVGTESERESHRSASLRFLSRSVSPVTQYAKTKLPSLSQSFR